MDEDAILKDILTFDNCGLLDEDDALDNFGAQCSPDCRNERPLPNSTINVESPIASARLGNKVQNDRVINSISGLPEKATDLTKDSSTYIDLEVSSAECPEIKNNLIFDVSELTTTASNRSELLLTEEDLRGNTRNINNSDAVAKLERSGNTEQFNDVVNSSIPVEEVDKFENGKDVNNYCLDFKPNGKSVDNLGDFTKDIFRGTIYSKCEETLQFSNEIGENFTDDGFDYYTDCEFKSHLELPEEIGENFMMDTNCRTKKKLAIKRKKCHNFDKCSSNFESINCKNKEISKTCVHDATTKVCNSRTESSEFLHHDASDKNQLKYGELSGFKDQEVSDSGFANQKFSQKNEIEKDLKKTSTKSHYSKSGSKNADVQKSNNGNNRYSNENICLSTHQPEILTGLHSLHDSKETSEKPCRIVLIGDDRVKSLSSLSENVVHKHFFIISKSTMTIEVIEDILQTYATNENHQDSLFIVAIPLVELLKVNENKVGPAFSLPYPPSEFVTKTLVKLHRIRQIKGTLKSTQNKYIHVIFLKVWNVDLFAYYQHQFAHSVSESLSSELRNFSSLFSSLLEELNQELACSPLIYPSRLKIGATDQLAFSSIPSPTKWLSNGITPSKEFSSEFSSAMDPIYRCVLRRPSKHSSYDKWFISGDQRLLDLKKLWPSNHSFQPFVCAGDIDCRALKTVINNHVSGRCLFIASPSIDEHLSSWSCPTCIDHESFICKRFDIARSLDPKRYASNFVREVKTIQKETKSMIVCVTSIVAINLVSDRHRNAERHMQQYGHAIANDILDAAEQENSKLQTYIESVCREFEIACILNHVPYLVLPLSDTNSCNSTSNYIQGFLELGKALLNEFPPSAKWINNKEPSEVYSTVISIGSKSYTFFEGTSRGRAPENDFTRLANDVHDKNNKLTNDVANYHSSSALKAKQPQTFSSEMTRKGMNMSPRKRVPISERIFDPRAVERSSADDNINRRDHHDNNTYDRLATHDLRNRLIRDTEGRVDQSDRNSPSAPDDVRTTRHHRSRSTSRFRHRRDLSRSQSRDRHRSRRDRSRSRLNMSRSPSLDRHRSRSNRSHSRSYDRNRRRGNRSRSRDSHKHYSYQNRRSRSQSRRSGLASFNDPLLKQALSSIAVLHNDECRSFLKNPASHPRYAKELQLFMGSAESLSMLAMGVQENVIVDRFNFIWYSRMQDIFEEDWQKKKKNILQMMSSCDSQISRKHRRLKSPHKRRKCRSGSSRSKSPKLSGQISSDEKSNKGGAERYSPTFDLSPETAEAMQGKTSDIVTAGQSHLSRNFSLSNTLSQDFDPDSIFALAKAMIAENKKESPSHSRRGLSTSQISSPGKLISPTSPISEEVDCSVNPISVLSIVNEMAHKIGPLSSAVPIMLQKIKYADVNCSQPLLAFNAEDLTLLKMIVAKFETILSNPCTSFVEKTIVQEANFQLSALVNLLENPPKPAINIEEWAMRTLHMNTNDTLRFLKKKVEGTDNAKNIQALYMALKDEHRKLILTTNVEDKISFYLPSVTDAPACVKGSNKTKKNIITADVSIKKPSVHPVFASAQEDEDSSEEESPLFKSETKYRASLVNTQGNKANVISKLQSQIANIEHTNQNTTVSQTHSNSQSIYLNDSSRSNQTKFSISSLDRMKDQCQASTSSRDWRRDGRESAPFWSSEHKLHDDYLYGN